ncbi:hypothetical protein CHS0354_040669 [Potamilus streckersoni]|uniref:DUF4773 domain-containing protein n=1 Tax=Potamilus streckersoni TaxID=2493646 RepID=A0AAE0TCD3_9BIVA|nr:hypothetical protein CHS0354_040669 [Potamilus streckersoni]
MALRVAFVFLFLVMVCGTPIQILQVDVRVFEEIHKAIKVEDLDLEDILKAIAKQCQCQGSQCLCCDSTLAFQKPADVCLEVAHTNGMFTLKLQAFNKQVWDDEIKESSVRKLIGQSKTVQISVQFGSVTGSGEITFHDIQLTPENAVSSCVDGKAVLERKGVSQSVTVDLGCFTV